MKCFEKSCNLNWECLLSLNMLLRTLTAMFLIKDNACRIYSSTKNRDQLHYDL